MKYFDGEFRKALMELLLTIRKLLEQSAIGSKDQNFTILINDIIKKIDEYSKIVKPAFFDFLEVSKIQKLQEDEFLKKKAEELEQSFEERVKAAVAEKETELEKSIRAELEKEFEKKAREPKKKQRHSGRVKNRLQYSLKRLRVKVHRQSQEIIPMKKRRMIKTILLTIIPMKIT